MTTTKENNLQTVARREADEDSCRNPALIHHLADRLDDVEGLAAKLMSEVEARLAKK